MRQFTDSERIARDAAKSSSDVPYLTDDLEHYIFDTGFAAALYHTDRQLAALAAENATLQMEIEAANIAAGEWEEEAADLAAERDSLRAEYERLRATCDEVADERLEQATVSNQLRAERDGLRAQIKNIAWAALKYEDATYKVKAYPSNGQYRRQLKKIHDILKAAQAEFGPEE